MPGFFFIMEQIVNLDGILFRKMLLGGVCELEINRKKINDLNVFPVPDGDTGDNMYMTLTGGLENITDESGDNIGKISTLFSQGTFMNARGNSGVILSRIISGISSVLKNNSKSDVLLFIRALNEGISSSYKAVPNPVEGTMLTVFKNSVIRTVQHHDDCKDFIHFFSFLIDNMKKALLETEEQLEVLKQAGVVDSGGAGLVSFFSGMFNVLNGTEKPGDVNSDVKIRNNKLDFSKFTSESELVFGYCTEFNLRLMKSKVGDVNLFDESEIFNFLNSAGDSVVCFRDDSIIRVHVHTKKPGEILNYCQKFGEFLTLKIENMTLQHNESVFSVPQKKIHKKYGIVVVANGEGVCRTFKELGVDCIIDGGQTMNPSVEDFITAYKSLNVDNIILFPNNSNVILTAVQSAEIYKEVPVYVIQNNDIGTSYAAIASLNSEGSIGDILSQIDECMNETLSFSISRADKDYHNGSTDVAKGDFIGISGKNIISSDKDRSTVLKKIMSFVKTDDYSLFILISGKNVDSKEAEKELKELKTMDNELELIYINGGQSVYDYVLIFQ